MVQPGWLKPPGGGEKQNQKDKKKKKTTLGRGRHADCAQEGLLSKLGVVLAKGGRKSSRKTSFGERRSKSRITVHTRQKAQREEIVTL